MSILNIRFNQIYKFSKDIRTEGFKGKPFGFYSWREVWHFCRNYKDVTLAKESQNGLNFA